MTEAVLNPDDPALAFLAGGGEATRLILTRDWTGHPLGRPQDWGVDFKAALSLVLNSPESMILCWGPDLHFFFNETYFPLLGPRLSWAMGARFDEVWADAWEQAEPIVREAFAGRSVHYDDLPWKLGTDRGPADTWFSFSYSRVLDATGAVAGLFVFTNETTKRVLADAALVASQGELQALNETLEDQVEQRTAERDRLWETSLDLLLALDLDGTIRRANPAWRELLGHDPEQLVGAQVLDLLHPDDRAPSSSALADLQQADLPRYENRYRHADGSYRAVVWTAARNATEIFAIGRDVTAEREAAEALRRTEEELRQAQKVEAIGQLTGGVAHDFNNLLTVIRGSLDLLRRPGLSEERRARYLDAISETTDRAARLTSQLLAFARRQALKPEVFEVREALQRLRGMLGTLSGSRIQLTLEPAARPLHVNVDASQFDTAIVNMAVNARDAMDGEGQLTITVAERDGAPPTMGQAAQAGRYVTVAVRDTGAGIAADQLARIFEPFYTTKEAGHGTGLGLSQVFGFAKQSGGEIAVASTPGEGATFTLYLPAADASPASTALLPAGPAARGDGACVLVVEDNAEVGAFAVQALVELGYGAVLASDAAKALALLAERREAVDLVFSDVVMPGMSGVELAAELRRQHPELPVILTSGYSEVLAEGGALGFPLLDKPYSIEELGRMLEHALRRAAAAA